MQNNKIKIPIIPLNNQCAFPHTVFHFDTEHSKVITGIEKAMQQKQIVLVTTHRNVQTLENGVQINLCEIGTISLIRQVIKLPKGIVRIVAEGICRGKILEFLEKEEYLLGEIQIEEKGLERFGLIPTKEGGLQEINQNTQKNNINNKCDEIKLAETNDSTENIPEDISSEDISSEIHSSEIYSSEDNNSEVDSCEINSQENTKKNYLFEVYRRELLERYQELSNLLKDRRKITLHPYDEIDDLEILIDQIASTFPIDVRLKIQVLGILNVEERYQFLLDIIINEIEIEKLRGDINAKTKQHIDKNQREYYMREQIKALKEELGDDFQGDVQKMRDKLAEIKASKEIKSRINKEIERFERISSNSSESVVERNYIETLLEMPWDKASEDLLEYDKAEKILVEDHYGLEKVKERILEYIAVRLLKQKGNSPIICLVGPPGTGKTSIAKSMARAMNKKYVRICLGGVHDEAEIRGHRKTYVGAMPGRIVTAIKQAGVKNPLILLDEIDKMSKDYKGDTAAAMLEVLDSEQNKQFMDHYLEIPIDLSEVVFIATANDLSQIDGPLRDRMEVIELTSYTTNEKFHIARKHLVKKQMKEHGISKDQLQITDKALQQIILCYTKEAGVRELERTIAKICRKVAKKLVNKKSKAEKVSARNLHEYLGKEKYDKESISKKDDVGIVRGLAWTSVGGVTLEIEVNAMPGKGEVKLTGQIGDVMKESAHTALSFVRSVSEAYQIPEDYFEKHDLHIHIPEGAVPKDGPSAGITLATAILSVVTEKKVKADVAMTGEVTLRGRVLPIGGLKEKMLAGKIAGAKTILIPEGNEKDLEEIDEEIKSGLNILPVASMNQVIETAFVDF